MPVRVRPVLLSASFAVLVIVGWMTTGWIFNDPPNDQITAAREALSRARQVGAPRYAPDEIEIAESAWDSTILLLKEENARPFFLRNYGLVKEKAASAEREASFASDRAEAIRDSLNHLISMGLTYLPHHVDSLKTQLNLLPRNGSWRSNLAEATALIRTAEEAMKREELWSAAAAIEKAQGLLDPVYGTVSGILDKYLETLPEWKHWAQETIRWSKKNHAPAIIVDKLNTTCYLYDSGRLKSTFHVELGAKWIGQKQFEGDLSTPEGQYHVVRKLDGRNTRYHKALVINYPSPSDLRRFRESQSQGLLPKSARIGGLIELHGSGGRGANWTRGCVALKNADMDLLYRAARIGTPVTIVGALSPPSNASTPPVRQ